MSDFIILEFINPGPPYVTIDGNDYYIDKNGKGIKYLLSCNHLMATCTKKVNKIKKGAYHNLKVLKCIRIPKSVKKIGLYAFSNCCSLISVVFDCDDNVSIKDVFNDKHFDTCSEIDNQSCVNSEHMNCLIDFESLSNRSSRSNSCNENQNEYDGLMDFTVYETSLCVFTINKINVLNTSIITFQFGTKSVKIIAVPYQCNSNVKITGGKNLKPGSNLVTVVVTSSLGDAKTYSVIVFVNLFFDELACLLEGTKVRTPEGYVPIETIQEGDYIRTLKYDIMVTKVGKWEVDLNDDKQRNDISRKIYKIPAGHLNCDTDTYISHYHRILIEDLENTTNTKLFSLPEKIGLELADPLSFSIDGKFRFYHIQVKYGNYFMISGGCIVEAWESGANYF